MSDNDASDDDGTSILPAEQFHTTVIGFRRLISSNINQFNHLDWTNIPKNIIDELFPIQEGRFGRLDHPPAFLKSTALVKQWRRIGGNEQQNEIDRLNEEEERERKIQAMASARERRSNRRSSADNNPFHTPSRQVKKGRFSDSELVPPTLERHDSIEESDDKVMTGIQLSSFTCHGISIATINASTINDKNKVKAGYAHIVGNAHRSTAHYLSNNNAVWPFGQDIAGYVMNPNAKDGDEHTWVCKRVVENEKKVSFKFAHRLCTGVAIVGSQLCTECKKNQYNFYGKCKEEVDKRKEAEKDPTLYGRIDYLKYGTPSILLPAIEESKKRIHVLRSTLWKRERAIRSLREQEVIATNVDHDLLYDEKFLKEAYKKLQESGEVTEGDMMDILFQECMTVRRRMKEQGNAKGHIYTAIMIRFAIMLRRKLSQSNYEFIRQVFGLPTNATLCEYKNADTTAEDGIMHETCIQQMQWMYEQGYSLDDFRRFVSMSFDSHTVRFKVGEFILLPHFIALSM